ncbi:MULTISPECIES: 3'-5' exonuclease [Chitinophagaceae]
MKEIVQSHLNGKPYTFYEADKDYTKIDFNTLWFELLARLDAEKEHTLNEITLLFRTLDIRVHIERSSAVKKSKEKYLNVLDDLDAFINIYSVDTSKVKDAFPDDFKALLDHFVSRYSNKEAYAQCMFFVEINNLAIQEITKGYTQYLSANNYVTYDALIEKLHAAIYSSSSGVLMQKLNEKYKAVFVDEFQDTDRKQYDIFFESFSGQGILFLIGDPKQSIYGWRKADMLTYFKARENVDRVYHMNINYRSSKVAIDAMNRFFKPYPDFDTFFYQKEVERIDYTNVDAPSDSGKGELSYENIAGKGMVLVEVANKSEIVEQVAVLVLQLLTDHNYRIKERGIEPADIGIVVRTNQQAMQIKAALSSRNIPSVVVNEEKVLTSQEALDILYLLYAVLEPSLSKINRFLSSELIGFGYKQLLLVDDNKALDIFQELNTIWMEMGIYPMLVKFARLFAIEEKWMQKAEGERKLTNFFHITELLNQMERKKKYGPEDLIAWLQRSIDGQERSGDEYELRMESDENAVKIVTIHKSKGLEYNIVIAPFLDLNSSVTNHRTFVQFYDYRLGQYVTKDTMLLTENEKNEHQTEQERENRRLIYVAITRAAYHFYVFHSKREKNASLAAFYSGLENDIVASYASNSDAVAYTHTDAVQRRYLLEASYFELLDQDWHKLSFTGLSYHGLHAAKGRTKSFASDYDAFVFDQLKFGATSGNLLHGLLEEVDFAAGSIQKDKIMDVLEKYLPNDAVIIFPYIEQLLENVLNVQIEVGGARFQLKQIPNYKRLSELEFDFPVRDFDYKRMSHFLSGLYPVQTRYFDSQKLQGLMNGKIDLFFELDGKYYILDWKSNYLGFDLDDYNEAGVLAAMNENNYHLQYLLYIIAVKKMLESRLPYFNYEKQFGGVVYLFLRGVRKESQSGIFTVKPSYKTITSLERMLC